MQLYMFLCLSLPKMSILSSQKATPMMNNDVMISMRVWVKSMRWICCFVAPHRVNMLIELFKSRVCHHQTSRWWFGEYFQRPCNHHSSAFSWSLFWLFLFAICCWGKLTIDSWGRIKNEGLTIPIMWSEKTTESSSYLQDHPRSGKWLITIVIISPLRIGLLNTPSNWPNFMAPINGGPIRSPLTSPGIPSSK